MAHAATSGYTLDDLDRLRAELGVAHLELDPWGSLIVTPATDDHETAMAVLHEQALRQLGLPPGSVRSNGFAWKVPGGSGYLNVPDLTVLAPGWHRVGDCHVDPPPLLVVEVASPSTRGVDRGRKIADYRLGGAGLYVLVDVAALSPTGRAAFEVHEFSTARTVIGTGTVDLTVAGLALRFDLSR